MKILALVTKIVSIFCIFFSMSAHGKTKKTRQIQEINFSEMNLKGTIRNPDGAYLVQKRGIKFIPLHDVQKDLDLRIRETALYIE